MLVATKRQPTSRQPSVSTQINNCLTVEFNPILVSPFYCFVFYRSVRFLDSYHRKTLTRAACVSLISRSSKKLRKLCLIFRRQLQKYGAVF